MQPNSSVTWVTRSTHHPHAGPAAEVSPPTAWPENPPVHIDDLKGQHVQAGRLTEWLKLALDEPALLEKLGANRIGCADHRTGGCGEGPPGAGGLRRPPAGRLDGPDAGALAAPERQKAVPVGVATP